MEDSKIIALFESRDEKALDACKTRYERFCFHIANRILGCREDAEEIVNDTYLKAWNTIPPQKPESIKAYLGMLTRQGALNRAQRSSAEKRGGGRVEIAFSELEECLSDDMIDMTDTVTLRDALNRFLRELPPTSRKVMIQRYWYLCSVEEIARSCGMSEGSVKVTLHRTRIRLKKFLEKEGISV
jgi:RNA polymerase sigma-70 factor (ECF subfamily)